MSDFQLISPEQLAQILDFSKKSIYVLSSRGSSSLPPAFHVGKALGWHPTVAQDWINQQAEIIPISSSSPSSKKSESPKNLELAYSAGLITLVEGGAK